MQAYAGSNPALSTILQATDVQRLGNSRSDRIEVTPTALHSAGVTGARSDHVRSADRSVDILAEHVHFAATVRNLGGGSKNRDPLEPLLTKSGLLADRRIFRWFATVEFGCGAVAESVTGRWPLRGPMRGKVRCGSENPDS